MKQFDEKLISFPSIKIAAVQFLHLFIIHSSVLLKMYKIKIHTNVLKTNICLQQRYTCKKEDLECVPYQIMRFNFFSEF